MPASRSQRIHSGSRTPRLLHGLLIIAIVLGGLVMPRQGQAQERPPLAPGYGPILVAVTGAPPAALSIHTVMATAGGAMTVASGTAADIAALRSQGATVTVLDADTAGRVYYLADATGAMTVDQVRAVADVLLVGSGALLLGTTPAREAELLASLPANGMALALLDTTRAAEAVATVGPAERDSGGTTTAPPDPAVAALLPLLTESDLRGLLDGLSGQTPVTVSGASVTLATRHTLSTQVRNAEDYVYQWYESLGIPVTYFTWRYGSYSGRNVIAEVRGSTNPEQVLIVGGHLDNTSQTPYTLAPGADDNATGTAATLLIARILRGYTPAITVRFVHFTGEEQGQWGSRVYAAYLRQRGERVLGFFDLDMIGYDGNGDRVAEIHTGTGPKSNALGTEFLARNIRYGQGITFERKMYSASRFSDHSPFWDNDIGAFLVIENFFTDYIASDRNPYYHNTGDLPARVDFDYVARIGRVTLATLAEMAGYALGGDRPTPTATATATATPKPADTPTLTPTATPGVCTNLLVNGNFEGATGWRFGPTPFPAAYVGDEVWTGARAVRQGIPSGYANRLAHSSTYQTVAIPANAPAPVLLRFAWRPGGAADGVDYREALLLTSSYGFLARLDRSYTAGDDTWVMRSFDLTAYRGRTVVLYFNVYNNGSGSQMWNYIDEVQFGSCPTALAGEPAQLVAAPVQGELTGPDAAVRQLTVSTDHVRLHPGAAATVNVSAPATTAWQAATDAPWLTLTATQGETPGELRIAADAANLAPGSYQAAIMVQDPLIPERYAEITVELAVGSTDIYLPAVQR